MSEEPTNTPAQPATDDATAPEADAGQTERTDTKVRARSRLIRWVALLAVLAASTLIGIMHQMPELFGTYIRTVPVDALCPFGGVESLWAMVMFGVSLKRIALSSFILLGVTIGVALVMGRSFCGQFCPLGALQEIFGRIGRKLFRKRPEVPASVDRWARYLKYAVLGVFTLWTWVAGELVMRTFDPWVAYHHLTSAELLTDFGIGAAVLAVAVAGSLVYDRFFCKYACPMGALLGIIQKISWMKVTRTPSVCIDCGACDKACPVNIKVATAGTVTSAECLACGECVNACPAAGALEFASKDGRSLSATAVTLGTLAAFVAVIGLATFTGRFEWTKPSLAEAGAAGAATEDCGSCGLEEICADEDVTAPDATAPAPTTGGTTAPSLPPFDANAIRGENSFAEIAQATGIPLAEILEAFTVDPADADKSLSEVKDTYGFGVGNVRDYVDWRVNAQGSASTVPAECDSAGTGST